MRKKILILGHNDATQFIDIYNQYTSLFAPDQYEVTVAYLVGQPNDDVKSRLFAEHIVFFDLPKSELRTLKIQAIKKLLAFCRENKFQIVICHRYKPSYIMMWVAQFCRIPALILVMHELNTFSSFRRQLLLASLSRKNMLFAGVSNAVRDDLKKDLWYPNKKRTVTLYNMIDVDLTTPQLLSRKDSRSNLNIAEDAFVFGNIARLAPNKNQTDLIQAFATIKPYCPQAKLILIGDGILADTLQLQAKKLGVLEDVIFTGFLASGFKYMKAFDCFVLSSIQEAFGRVLLEAMIAKIPIIATRVHGIPEVIANVGLLVAPKNADEIATAMKKVYLFSTAERNEQIEKAYQHVIENFSIPAFHQQFWEIPLVKQLKAH